MCEAHTIHQRMGGHTVVTFEGNLLKVRRRVINKDKRSSKASGNRRPVPSASASSSIAAENACSVVTAPSGVYLRPPLPEDSTAIYKAMSCELRNVEKSHIESISNLAKNCNMQHTINTIGCEAVLVSSKTLDIEVLHDLIVLPEVVEYNRSYGVVPTINQLRFNQARGILIAGRGHLSRNCIHAKFFKTMKMQVTGPRTMNELEGVLEYLRGMVAVMLGCHVKIDTPILHNINSGLQLDLKIDRLALTSELMSTMSIRGKPYESTHRQVQYDPEGKKKYAGVRLKVFSGNEKNMPSLMVFHTGYIMIMARSFKLMETAVKYVSKLVSCGTFERTRLPASQGDNSSADIDKMAEESIHMFILNEINGGGGGADLESMPINAAGPTTTDANVSVPIAPQEAISAVMVPALQASNGLENGLPFDDMTHDVDDIDVFLNSLLELDD